MDTDYREQFKDYALMMLGAPVVKVELTDEQLDIAYEDAVEQVGSYFIGDEFSRLAEESQDYLLQTATFINAARILARIRGKYRSLEIDGAELREEAGQTEAEWKETIVRMKKKLNQ